MANRKLVSGWFTDEQFPVSGYRILARRKLNEEDIASPLHFWLMFRRLNKLDVLLEKNVTMYCVDEQYAYFVETDSNVDVYSSNVSPFVYMAQYQHAKKFYVVPIPVFTTFVDNLPKCNTKVALLSNTGRCGSTLLTQVLEGTGRVLAMSEPDTIDHFANVCIKKGGVGCDSTWKRLALIFQFYAYCAHINGGYDLVCIKTRNFAQCLVPIVHEHAPWVNQLYMYRKGVKIIESFMKIIAGNLQRNPEFGIVDMDICKHFFKTYLQEDLCSALDMVTDGFTFGTLFLAGAMRDYKRYIEEGINIPSVKYEKFLQNPKGHLQAMGEHFKLDFTSDEIDHALDSLKRNSQQGTDLGIFGPIKPQREIRQDCNEISKRFGVPSIYSDEELPGRILA
ncbi:hypothetical protein CAPTEDRAFT_208974 [Capitella teleta]|uniref:Sulfotransferase domain-containing protein n=1 Tax=Capitella teleta TaxID=283909 RepID=R7V4N9_CAPTE|nr:hypothetical protein CAPTEDRAFT_208974 [Capitella teleta]|eukprot:ELU10730.1 hypothetical protein CAPTEDRAFT_208974 [Capitella teleta]